MGLEQALDVLESLRFSADEIRYLRTVPALAAAPDAFFDELLPSFRFTGDVWAVAEGEVVFPHEPMLRVTAPAVEAQLVETALLATITFQTSIASKTARIVRGGRGPAGDRVRQPPGARPRRRAPRGACGVRGRLFRDVERRGGLPVRHTRLGHDGALVGDVVCARDRRLPCVSRPLRGTHDRAHRHLRHCRCRARDRPNAGLRPGSVRLDSGDLVALSREVRRVLDAGGLPDTRIFVSGDLDEHRIAQLLADAAPIDAFGVGTALSTSSDAPALGGVYKLVEIERDGVMAPVLKLSAGKRTLPGSKQVWRLSQNGRATGDVLALASEPSPGGRPLLSQVMRGGQRLHASPGIEEVRRHAADAVRELPDGLRRLQEWDAYPVRPSEALEALASRAEAVRRD